MSLTALPSPVHSDADFDLDVMVQSIESNPTDGEVSTLTAQHTFQAHVIVQAVADTPSATGQNYVTDEDTGIAFAGLDGSLVDVDGSETLSFQITGVDADAGFNVGTDEGGGVWCFTPAEIAAGVIYSPPPQEHGTFNMTLEAIATEAAVGGQVAVKTAVGTAPIVVTINPVLDTPVLNDGSTTVNEDNDIPLGADIDLSLADVDGSQTMDITLTGISTAHTVNWNNVLPGVVNVDAGTGVVTISGTAQEAMDILDSLTVTPPAHDDTNFTVAVNVYTEEAGGDNVTVTSNQDVTVSAVADVPTLSSAGGTGDEDHAIDIPVNVALVDTDGTETLDYVDITGVPADATLMWDGALPRSIDPIVGGYRFTGTEAEIQALLATLQIQRGLHIGDDVTLTANAHVTEANPTEAGDIAVATATKVISIPVDVVPVADQPTVSVGGPYAGEEDTMISLAGLGGALVDMDTSETLTFQVDNVPANATFSAGTDLGGGIWSFTAAQISAGVSFQAPLNLHGTFNMNLTSIATESENGSVATNSLPFSVVVDADADADAPTVSVAAAGDEDTLIDFGSQVSVSLFDTDGSEFVASITIDMSLTGVVPVYVEMGGATVTTVGDTYLITGQKRVFRRHLILSS